MMLGAGADQVATTSPVNCNQVTMPQHLAIQCQISCSLLTHLSWTYASGMNNARAQTYYPLIEHSILSRGKTLIIAIQSDCQGSLVIICKAYITLIQGWPMADFAANRHGQIG